MNANWFFLALGLAVFAFVFFVVEPYHEFAQQEAARCAKEGGYMISARDMRGVCLKKEAVLWEIQ